jgi:hypothetical protein
VSLALITNVLRTRNGEEEKRSKRQELKWTQMSLSHKSLSLWNEFGTWRGFDLLFCVLEWSLELLYWMQWLKTWMPWSVVVGGIYSPNHQNGHWGGCLSMGALDSPVRQSRHPTVRVRPLELWQPGPPIVRWCTGQDCSLSGVPSGVALTSARSVRAL